MLKITNGPIDRPKKVVIYGVEGLGKTTLASKFPEPLFLDTEGGSSNYDLRRIDKPQSWDELMGIVKEVAAEDCCRTFVIDTLDSAEVLAIKHICQQNRVTSLEQIAYGKGYSFVGDQFIALLEALDKVIASGKHVVLIAHAKPRKFELPDEMGQFDKYEMKLSRQVAPVVKEWCDLLLFLNYKTVIVNDTNNKAKAVGGKRTIYTSHRPTFDAKNRFDLPDEMDLDYKNLSFLFERKRKEESDAVKNLRANLALENIDEADLRKVVAKKKRYKEETPLEDYDEDFINGWIIPNLAKISQLIEKGGNR